MSKPLKFNPLRFVTLPVSQQDQALVAKRAYFLAENRGFEPGHELEDWLAAEAELRQVPDPRSQDLGS